MKTLTIDMDAQILDPSKSEGKDACNSPPALGNG